MTRSPRLNGKVAIVTGAGGGIGGAIARQFVAEGARVVCADIDEGRAASVAASLGEAAVAVTCDVADPVHAERASRLASERFGGLHILVNNAAVWIPDATVETVSFEDWNRTLSVNLTGAVLMSKYAIAPMRRQGGSIIHIASQLGHVGKAGRFWYCAAKAGLIQLAKAMALDHAADGIRVNSISPGPVATERIIRKAGGVAAIPSVYGAYMLTPRIGRPEEIAHCAVFLAADESSYVTGADLLVDGGYTAH